MKNLLFVIKSKCESEVKMLVIIVAFVLSLQSATADEAKTEIENLYEEYFNWKLKTWPEDVSGCNSLYKIDTGV